jgi:hypothetical protein
MKSSQDSGLVIDNVLYHTLKGGVFATEIFDVYPEKRKSVDK